MEFAIEGYEIKESPKKRWLRRIMVALMILATFFIAAWWETRPPINFPENVAVTIPRGFNASEVADLLKEKHVVRSPALLYAVILSFHDPSAIQAGTYLFQQPLSVFEVADRITRSSAENLVALTLPEGYTIKEYGRLSAAVLANFDATEFERLAAGKEGRMFPDTYYLPVDFSPAELVSLLSSTYEEKTTDRKALMTLHALKEDGVLILASILEREANTEEAMRMVSGILQNRLRENMPLQADASIEYVLGRPLNRLKPEDLEIDSPYNTYKNRGLPPTPIGNPGLTAINAVLTPTESDYLYYITDKEGVFHYAKTFDEHRQNIANYLQ